MIKYNTYYVLIFVSLPDKKLEMNKAESTNTEEKKIVKYSFTLSSADKSFFDRLIYTRIVKGTLNYNLKKAFFEGLEIIQDNNPDIPKRLDLIKRSNKLGRNGSGEKRYNTSVISTLEINDWIQDYISYKISFNPYYTTGLFINEIINVLNEKYKGKLLKIPKT